MSIYLLSDFRLPCCCCCTMTSLLLCPPTAWPYQLKLAWHTHSSMFLMTMIASFLYQRAGCTFLVPHSLVIIIHTHTHTSFPPFPHSSFPSPLSFQDAITAVFQDCDYPSLSRNKNLENFKRRCELTSYHAAFHNTQ